MVIQEQWSPSFALPVAIRIGQEYFKGGNSCKEKPLRARKNAKNLELAFASFLFYEDSRENTFASFSLSKILRNKHLQIPVKRRKMRKFLPVKVFPRKYSTEINSFRYNNLKYVSYLAHALLLFYFKAMVFKKGPSKKPNLPKYHR